MNKAKKIRDFLEESTLLPEQKEHLLLMLPEADETVIDYLFDLVFSENFEDKITIITHYLKQQKQATNKIQAIEKQASSMAKNLEV
jgi:hypothetical protein